MATNGALEIGWFGKLPCAGDFIYRRLPRGLLSGLDNWLQQGLSQLRGTYPAEWRGIYDTAPTWNCAIPATVTQGQTLIGLISPSRDRVGREFPLCAGIALPEGVAPAALLACAHDWLQQLGRTVAQAKARPTTVDAFDAALNAIPLPAPGQGAHDGGSMGDILSMLNVDDGSEDVPTIPMPLAHSLPWPDLPRIFDAQGVTSYWWTNTGAGGPLRGFTTDIGLAPSLMLTLMRPQFGARRA